MRDIEFFKYFPEIFVKRNPPRESFWKVLAAIRPEDWQAKVGGQLMKIISAKKIRPDRFKMTDESNKIFQSFEDSTNIGLISSLTSAQES
jgi:hypothetical protein